MSGAGSFGAGSAPAGTYVPSTTSSTRVVTPWALRLDAASRDFSLDENGRYIAVHPVEHRAMMLLVPRVASIRSASAQGTRWDDLPFDDEGAMTARWGEILRESWRDLIAAGDLRIDSFRAHPVNPWGRGRVEVTWTNLRDPVNPNRTTSF